MQAHAGVFRTSKLLAEGVGKVNELTERVKHVHLKDKSKVFNTAKVEALELANLIEVARATMVSAEARTRTATSKFATTQTGCATRYGSAKAIASTTSR